MRNLTAPAGRLLGAVVAVLGIATVPLHSPAGRYAVIIATAVALVVLRPPLRTFLWRSLLAAPMLAGLLLPLALGGNFELAFRLAVRAMCSLMTVLAFTGRLTASQLPQALATLHFPYALTTIISTLVRQLSAIRDQGQRIVLSRKLRGATGTVVNAEVLASLLTRTARRADRVQLAMRLRGARSASMAGSPLTLRELPMIAFGAVLAIASHCMRWLS